MAAAANRKAAQEAATVKERWKAKKTPLGVELDQGEGFLQATSFTIDGPYLRFALAGSSGAYAIEQGAPEFETVKKVFVSAGLDDPDEEKPKAVGAAPKSVPVDQK